MSRQPKLGYNQISSDLSEIEVMVGWGMLPLVMVSLSMVGAGVDKLPLRHHPW